MSRPSRFPSFIRSWRSLAASVVVGSFLLSGCAPEGQGADGGESPQPTTPPVFFPEGTARENQPYFDFVNRGVLASSPADSTAFLRALVAAGFSKESIASTMDRTTVDLQADSVEFAARIGESCLIGQWGHADNRYTSMVADPVAEGACLVGTMRPVDW